ncbi:hypothetical protein IFR05_017543, partial [Cadophora sp. M221]
MARLSDTAINPARRSVRTNPLGKSTRSVSTGNNMGGSFNRQEDGLAPPTEFDPDDVVISVDLGTHGVRVGVWANGEMSNVDVWPNGKKTYPSVATVGPSGIVTGHQALNDAEVSSSEIIRN